MLHVDEAAHGQPSESPEEKLGCLLLLRDGRGFICQGLSITQAKHMRRQNGIGFVTVKGKSVAIQGSNIKKVLPIPSPA